METSIPDECLHRYPRRVKVRKHYQEPELSDEDEYLCELISESINFAKCNVHVLVKILQGLERDHSANRVLYRILSLGVGGTSEFGVDPEGML